MIVKHTIHQLIFEIEGFKNNPQFQTIASQISSLVRVTLENELDKMLSKYNIEGYHIILENIEIDIGAINAYNLKNSLPRLIRLELDKQLKVVNTKATYDIKHKKADSLEYISQKEVTLSKVLEQKQIETSYELSKDPTHYFKTISHQKVIPEDARYFDAVIHYLEYGWLPRYLDIPMLEFDKILVKTLTTYGEEIVKHFGRKPNKQREKVTERILRQTAKNRFLKQNKKATKALSKTILGKNSTENVQTFIKFLEHIATGSQSFTKQQKEDLILFSEEFEESAEIIKSITGINSNSFNPFHELNERIKNMLNDDNKTLFNSILESNFYKSLVQSYVPKSDSFAVILRTLLPLILTPDKAKEIFLNAPELIDSENEIINQLYSRSPFLVNKTFKSIREYNSTPERTVFQVTTLFSKLSKKHINKILKSYFSNYSSLAIQLNDINKIITQETYNESFEYVSNKILGLNASSSVKPSEKFKFSHTQLLNLIILSNKTPEIVLKEYINEIRNFFVEKKIKTNKDIIKKLEFNEKIKNRYYSEKEFADAIVLQTIDQEQILLQKQSEEITLYSFRTLLKDFYLPVKFSPELSTDFTTESAPKNFKEEQKSLSDSQLETNEDVILAESLVSTKVNESEYFSKTTSEEITDISKSIVEKSFVDRFIKQGLKEEVTSKKNKLTDKTSKNKILAFIKNATTKVSNLLDKNSLRKEIIEFIKKEILSFDSIIENKKSTEIDKSQKSDKTLEDRKIEEIDKIKELDKLIKSGELISERTIKQAKSNIESFILAETKKITKSFSNKIIADGKAVFENQAEVSVITEFSKKVTEESITQFTKQFIKDSNEIFNKLVDERKKLEKKKVSTLSKTQIEKRKIEVEKQKKLEIEKEKIKNLKSLSKISYATNISDLLDQFERFKIKKTKILSIFTDANILKNPVLANLTRNTFYRLIKTTLSTNKARVYIKFFEKYERIFKVSVSTEQIQLIFLNLIKYHKVIDEKNIFKLYYEELKKLKGWTYDVHKKKLIQMYDTRSDILSQDERDEYIKYVDEIPTYLGLELRDTKKKLSEGIPVKNAGLCLLWPFFKTLFSVSGYLTPKGEFKNVEMRERSTLLLQYLAVSSTAIEEPYLALNKIFTGLPLEESLPQEIILTEKEKDIADALLLNVIKQWPSFNNSSTENLRGSFIIRDGVLSFRGKQWTLRVERKAYDLLLGKLPWGFSMIRLSWIPYIVKVEWN